MYTHLYRRIHDVCTCMWCLEEGQTQACLFSVANGVAANAATAKACQCSAAVGELDAALAASPASTAAVTAAVGVFCCCCSSCCCCHPALAAAHELHAPVSHKQCLQT